MNKEYPYEGKFGMFEMECAAEIIMNKIEKFGSMATFTHSDFYNKDSHDGGQAMTGYCELLHRGWLDRALYNGQYTASYRFLERLVKNPQDIPKYRSEPIDECDITIRRLQNNYKGLDNDNH